MSFSCLRALGAISALLPLFGGIAVSSPLQSSTNIAYVTVLDRRQTPVVDLAASDLVLRENGVEREVSEVELATEPLAIAVLVDTARPPLGTFAATQDIRRAMTAFVDRIRASEPESKFALMETGGAAVVVVPFTDNAADIAGGIGRLYQTQRSSAVVLEALQAISRTLSEQRETRRAIISIDFDSQDTSRIRPDEFASAVQRAGASVIAVSVRSEGNPAPGRNGVLAWISDVTGGLRLTGIAPSALEGQLTTVARALASQYRVTYRRPPGTPIGELRGTSTRGSTVLVTRAYSN
jgi:hypothetical protein